MNKLSDLAVLYIGSSGPEQYAGDLECVFYGYHLDRAILKIAEAAYCLMPSLATCVEVRCIEVYLCGPV